MCLSSSIFAWAQFNQYEPRPEAQRAYGYGWTDQRHWAKVGSCSQDREIHRDQI